MESTESMEHEVVIYDKTLIYLDNSNMIKASVDKCDFYIDILEPIRNVLYIKSVSSSIKFNNTTQDGNSVYISLNNYNKMMSIIDGSKYIFFERFNIISNIGDINYNTYFNPNDISVYILNPPEPNFRRFNIKLFDKNNNIISQSDLNKFNITLCVYSSKKKF